MTGYRKVFVGLSMGLPAIFGQLMAQDTSTYARYSTHPYLPMDKPAVYQVVSYYAAESKDYLFYMVAGLVFLLAFIRAVFPKYFRNLFLLFFQTSLRQKQTREQLLQDGMASLLINLFFVVSCGMFLTLVARYYGWSTLSFETLFLYTSALLILIYTGKYLFVSFMGWVFSNREAASGYVFVFSIINRIIGILLLPLGIVLAFAQPAAAPVVITLGLGLVLLLFLYRYLISFGSLRNELTINPLHFFLYLCLFISALGLVCFHLLLSAICLLE